MAHFNVMLTFLELNINKNLFESILYLTLNYFPIFYISNHCALYRRKYRAMKTAAKQQKKT